MAIPSSGPISLFGIAKELKIDDYYSTISVSTFLQYQADDLSLTDMSTGADDFSGDSINLSNPSANRPDGSTPHAMSEFYSYDHDYLSPYIYLGWSRTVGSTAASNTLWTDPNNTYNTDDIVDPTGSGTTTRWRQSYFDISPYQGRRIKLIIGFNHGTASFRCDVCLNSWYMTNSVDEYFEGRTEGVFTGYAKQKIRNMVVYADQNSDNENVVMQRHSQHNQANPIYLSGSWSNFPGSSITTNPLEGSEGASVTDGEWNWYNSSYTAFPETGSNNTGPLNNYIARDNNSDGEMDSEQLNDNNRGYTYYEASNQSSQRYAWFRSVAIDVPDDGDKIYFNYCAYSNDQTNWYNSWLQIWVQLD